MITAILVPVRGIGQPIRRNHNGPFLSSLTFKSLETYLKLLKHLADHGEKKEDRTGVGTLSTFGYQMRFNLQKGFPMVTTKKLHLKSIVHELLWFIRGERNIDYLNRNGVRIWDQWADESGDLGPIYGVQWRKWRSATGKPVDQLSGLVENIKKNPNSRRLVVSSWNVGELENMALPPCHVLFQFYVSQGRLSCQLYQRSADVFLGVPFNICSYALLTLMIAQITNLIPGEFIHTLGDAHLYLNHKQQAQLQLAREPRKLPRMTLNPAVKGILDFQFEDFTLEEYDPHPSIRAPVAV